MSLFEPIWTYGRGLPQPLAISASLRLLSLLSAGTAPSLASHLLSSSSSFGGDRGRNQKGMADMNMRPDEMRKPIHQAPTQRASFGVMVTLSEWHESFCLNAQQGDCVVPLSFVYFNDIPSTCWYQTGYQRLSQQLLAKIPTNQTNLSHTYPSQQIQRQHTVWHKKSPPGNQICGQWE